MSQEENVVAVKVLDRQYKIKCPPDQTLALQEAANHLNEEMKKIRQGANISDTERVAMVTALNICHELMQLRKQKNNHIDVMNQRIQDLQSRIETFLASGDEITA